MQCVILAAGKGTRMLPITETIPKPLVSVLDKPVIDHIIDSLPETITELIVVVGYKADILKKHLGAMYKNRKVTYVTQDKLLGTAAALNLCKDILEEKFLVMPGDDIHGKEAIEELVSNQSSLAVSPSEHPERFGVVVTDKDGFVTEIIEKPENPTSNLVSTGAMVLTSDIFSYSGPLHSSGEYYLTDMITNYTKTHKMRAVRQEVWLPIGYPEDIITAESRLRLCD
jgi:NDP-sugar pyrophosphorylase family protein